MPQTIRAMFVWAIAIVAVLSSMYLTVSTASAVVKYQQRSQQFWQVNNFANQFTELGKAAIAVFTPPIDVHGAANCTGARPAGAANPWCHEADFYAQDARGNKYWRAFIYENGGVQEYSYNDPRLYAGQAPSGLTAIGNPVPLTFFQVRAIPMNTLHGDPAESPVIAAIINSDGIVPTRVASQTAFSGVQSSTDILHAEFGNAITRTFAEAAAGIVPLTGIKMNVGLATPTPAPGIAGGGSVLFPYPGAGYAVDSADTNVAPTVNVSETSYHDYYVGAFGGGCAVASFPAPQPGAGGVYSGTYRDANHPTPPTPAAGTPAVFPNPNNDANQSGAATLTMASAASGNGGPCSGSVTDLYNQARPANVNVMAFLAASTNAVSWAATDSSTQSVSIYKLWDANTLNPSVVGNTCAGIATASFGSATTPGSPNGSTPAARPFNITPVTSSGRNVGGSCVFTIASQYSGEPTVQIALNVTPGPPPSGPLNTHPFAIEFPPAGGQVASLNRMVNLPLAMIGGPQGVQIALAGYPNCGVGIARAFSDNFTTPDANDAQIGTDAGGCMNGGALTAVQQTGSARLFNDLDTCRPDLTFGAMSNGNAGPGWDSFSVTPVAQTPLCQYKTYSDLNPLSGVGAQAPDLVYARIGASGAVTNTVTNDQSYTMAGGCDPSGTFSPDVTQNYTYSFSGPINLTDAGAYQTVTGTGPAGQGHVHESSDYFGVIYGLKGGSCTSKTTIVKYHYDWYFDVANDGSIMLTSTSQGNGL